MGQPDGGGERAACKDVAIASTMGQFQTLTIGSKHHRVFADDVAATQGSEADLVGFARPNVAMARIDCMNCERMAAPLRNGMAKFQGRAGGSVFLALVV